MELMVEEMLANILPFTGPIHITADYSEKTEKVGITFIQEGFTSDIMDGEGVDALSKMLIEGFCSEIEETSDGNSRTIRLTLKN